jgi:GDP-L-fucose synthase
VIFNSEKPDQVYLAAAKVGGILANNAFPADFTYINLMIKANVIDAAIRSGVRRLLFCVEFHLSEVSGTANA